MPFSRFQWLKQIKFGTLFSKMWLVGQTPSTFARAWRSTCSRRQIPREYEDRFVPDSFVCACPPSFGRSSVRIHLALESNRILLPFQLNLSDPAKREKLNSSLE